MEELLDLIIATLREDAALVQLLGVRDVDPRIYRYYEPDAVISDTQRAYITVALTANPGRTGAVREPVFTLAIWGKRYHDVEQVRDRVFALLDFEGRSSDYLTTASGRHVQPMIGTEHDSAQENTKFAGRTMTITFGSSAV